jgi:hypothetical protein
MAGAGGGWEAAERKRKQRQQVRVWSFGTRWQLKHGWKVCMARMGKHTTVSVTLLQHWVANHHLQDDIYRSKHA